MEIIQLTPYVAGTFDVLDVVVEILAEIGAVLIIKKHCSETTICSECNSQNKEGF
jgi:hypothetical protein